MKNPGPSYRILAPLSCRKFDSVTVQYSSSPGWRMAVPHSFVNVSFLDSWESSACEVCGARTATATMAPVSVMRLRMGRILPPLCWDFVFASNTGYVPVECTRNATGLQQPCLSHSAHPDRSPAPVQSVDGRRSSSQFARRWCRATVVREDRVDVANAGKNRRARADRQAHPGRTQIPTNSIC